MSTTYKKVVLLTGGSSGLGLAFCHRLAALGHTVYGTSRNPDRDPSGWRLIAMDIRDEGSVERAVQEVLLREQRIDVVVNNAGLGIQGAAEEQCSQKDAHGISPVNWRSDSKIAA